ncbi:Fumarate reductase subunit C [hydrothermal vent metagenome]|uniref:Fumarate reductase subunit C n=1 Tax=hydrothermal vent metagenome TaxID=652676 RepID=A0A3B0U9V6_9ZZZZ
MSSRPYIRRVSRYGWWLKHPRYIRYMAREASCIFIGAYSVVITVGLWRLSQGQAAWNNFLAAVQSPLGISFHLLAFAFALYHSITWFNVTPKAMPVQIGQKQLPGGIIVAAHYIVWALVSALVFYLAGAL